MPNKHSIANIMKLSVEHMLPPALIKWRLMTGFPSECIGATDLDGVTYFNRTFEQEPFVGKKPVKTQPKAATVPRYTPAPPKYNGHTKVTYKRKPRF